MDKQPPSNKPQDSQATPWSDAELRRVRFLHWNRKPADADAHLDVKLQAERDAIFSLLMVPYLQWILAGAKAPDDRSRVRRRFALINDPIAAFVEQCCVFGPQCREQKEDVTAAWEVFCDGNSLSEGIQDTRVFWKLMQNRYPDLQFLKPNGDKRVVLGLKLLDAVKADLPIREIQDW